MSRGVEVSRPVDPRKQQKQVNRDAMVDAASALFASVGFVGTTMDAVAAGSGMSVQSVYFAFHNKASLLRAALERAGLPAALRLAEPEPDPDRALTLLVEQAVRILQETGSLALAAAAAAPGDAAVEEVWVWYERQRAQLASDLVQQLRARRRLAHGVTPRRATDVVYGLLSPQLHALMVRERGWKPERYAAWSAESIGRALWG